MFLRDNFVTITLIFWVYSPVVLCSAAKDWTVDDKDGKYQVVEDDDSKEMALSYTLNKIKKNKSELDENKATLNKIIIKWKQIVSDVSTDFRDLKKYEELRKDEILDRRRNVIERASFPRTRGRMAPLRGNCDFVIRPVNKIVIFFVVLLLSVFLPLL